MSLLAITATGDGPVPLTFDDQGEGPAVLLLHGGGGPQTVLPFAGRLAGLPARVLTPTHPGFAGTPRPDGLSSIAGLARLYVQLLDELDLIGVTVVGNSIGGWIAAEIALLNSSRVGRIVLVDAVGLQLDQAPIVDFFALQPDQVFDLSYHRPDDFRVDFHALPAPAQAVMAGNRAALQVYGGRSMSDPSLLDRLPATTAPALVVWGAADRIVLPVHGETYAATMPKAQFHRIPDAGHLPQLETPETLYDLIKAFYRAAPASRQ